MRCVRVLVLDSRGLEWDFHDVTIVDMGNLPESSVSMHELSLLHRHMIWLQQDLDTMRAEAKKRFRNARPGKCFYCDKWIKCDMYRHVATYHLDLVQLWRCPVSWCTMRKGMPQDCMDHVRGAHDVPWDAKSASLDKFVPPWTVQRQIWSDSLTANHSGISTDMLLFSDIHLSLTHHYRVHKRGLPHIAFRKDYLTRLRVSMSQAAAQSRRDTMSPVPSSPVSPRHARSAEQYSESPRKTRRARCRMRPVRVLEESVGELPTLTVQDPSDLQDAIVYDCGPPLLPVSLRLEDIGPLSLRRTVVSASLAAPPLEDFMAIGGMSPERVAIPELGVVPLVDPDTDLEDELPTPDDSMLLNDYSPEGARLPGVHPTPLDLAYLELERALLSVSILPAMVTPLEEPVEVFPVAPSTYPEPPVPVQPDVDPGVASRVSPLRVAADRPGCVPDLPDFAHLFRL